MSSFRKSMRCGMRMFLSAFLHLSIMDLIVYSKKNSEERAKKGKRAERAKLDS